MGIEQVLQSEIHESQRALDGPIDNTIYRRDHSKRIELINWVLENMKNQSIPICEIIETKMNEIIDKINNSHSPLEADPLDSELMISEWIFYQVCSNKTNH
jgi:hypothetical protein